MRTPQLLTWIPLNRTSEREREREREKKREIEREREKEREKIPKVEYL